MSRFRPKVISLNKKPGQTFGFYLRLERDEEGHLIRCLEMGGPAELAGMKDGDRIVCVNGTFVDNMSHSDLVDLVKSSGASVTFHILDEESYKQAKAQGVDLATPQRPPVTNGAEPTAPKARLCYLVNSKSGFGFSLSSVNGEPGMFIKLVTPGGVAQNAGLNVNDRLVEINGENIEGLSHAEVVDMINKAGKSLMFLVVDEKADEYYKKKSKKTVRWLASVKHLPHKPRIAYMRKGPRGFGLTLANEKDKAVDQFTDQMYKLGNVSPMLFYDTLNDQSLPPSYSEALFLPAKPSTPEPEKTEELEPKLCRMQKISGTFGFHLNGIEGIAGHFISEVVKDGAADMAGINDNDIVVEVNGVNVENRSHNKVVEMIQRSGNSLEMLVAAKSVYEQLKATGVNITSQRLGQRPEVQVRTRETNRDENHQQDSRPETPTEAARERVSPPCSFTRLR
ncbi:unnamed protein product [Tetraodon nigroviridis]|uniref:(spotted green pufferfish) hypothetical protein n=1 Tax=Tetraodon nigroviridis TaxID=99883 RepID=Q4S0H4_TETNG|nr:unnamed protein product [Tetraodon nigroviridis]